MDDLFSDGSQSSRPHAPLAVRMRPQSLAEVVGQQHVLGEDSPLGRVLRADGREVTRSSLVLWGPPGTGKTTLATLVAASTGDHFEELSAVTAGIKDVRAVIEAAKRRRELNDTGTVLFIDEVHRFSKTQQDALLPAVENGWVTLIAATTENPSFSVIAPLLSRSLLVPLRSLRDEDVEVVVRRAIEDPRGLGGNVVVTTEAVDQIVRVAGGDVRRALTVLEAAAPAEGSSLELTSESVEKAVAHALPRYDRDGDQHYDVTSALIKSIRGSDVDAAMHYLARMVVAGEDPRFIARRLVILASEDIGMADPTALQTAVAAMHTVSFVGLPEARITLAHAVVHLSLAPKSNRVYAAIGAAIADVEAGRIGIVPAPLRDGSSSAARAEGAGEGYRYPHDEPTGIVAFQYAPDSVAGRRYYVASDHGAERRWGEMATNIRNALGHDDRSG
ncbi:MAG: replication-associated recombination protein A [Candidatus Nanopelagicales bacterium]